MITRGTAPSTEFILSIAGGLRTGSDPLNPPPLLPDTATYTTNNLNQYTSIQYPASSIQLTYDLDGNLTNDGTFQYDYDAENRLISATPLDTASGLKKVEFAYDYMSRRVQKSVYEWQTDHWSLSTEHWFTYEGWNVIKEHSTGGTTQTDFYVWGLDLSGSLQGAGGIGGLFFTTNSLTSETFLYLYDANGNVGQLLNQADGSIAARYAYDPFGELLVSDGPEAEQNPYRFSTKRYHPEIGWYDYGKRYYSPKLGRWPTRDPLEEEGGLNLYGFVGNNPLNQIDFLGQFSEFIDCCPCQENVLKNNEKLALQQITDLINNIQQAIAQRPQARETDSDSHIYDKYTDKIARELEEALNVLQRTKRKLPKCKVKCIKKDSGKLAMSIPLFPTIRVYEGKTQSLYWHLTDEAQAATLVHEVTHMAALTTDAEYFLESGKGIRSEFFASYPQIASTYDTWILAGFCVPGLNCPGTTISPNVYRGGKLCP